MANYAFSNHDVIGPGWDAHVITASYQRTHADYNEERLLLDSLVVETASVVLFYAYSNADSVSASDATTKLANSARGSHGDTASAADSVTVNVGFVRVAADTATATDAAYEGDVTWRLNADTVSTTDDATRSSDYARSEAESVSPTDAHFFPFHFDQHHTNADTVTATDAAVETDGYARAEAETVTADDTVVEATGFNKSSAEAATAADALTANIGYSRVANETVGATDALLRYTTFDSRPADTATASDSATRSTTSARAVAEALTATDAAVEIDGFQRGPHADTASTSDALAIVYDASRVLHSNTRFITETVSVVSTYARSNADTVTATDTGSDPESVLTPRMAYARHVYELPHKPNPSVVVQAKDWSHGSMSGAGNGALVILSRGKEEKLYKSAVGNWSDSGKSRLAVLMSKGLVNFYEQYLNTVRQLSHWQVATYQVTDNPWVTWVSHKALTGAPVADESSPTRTTLGVIAVEFAHLKVKALFTGGTSPTMKVTAWHRDIYPTYRGTWTEGATELVVTNNAEFTIANAYREVWLQCHTISGAPTGITVYLSGTGN